MSAIAPHTQPGLPPASGFSSAARPRKQVSFEVIAGALLSFKIVVALVWLLIGQLLGSGGLKSGLAAPAVGGPAAARQLPVISGAAGIIGQPVGFIAAPATGSPPPPAKVQPGFGLGMKEAWAQEPPAATPPRPAAVPPPPASSQPNPSPASRPPLGGDSTPGGERELAKREMALKARASALSTLEDDLNRKLADLEAAKVEMEALVRRNEALLAEQKRLKEERATEEEQLKSARIEHLVTAYRSMKPEQAANLINSMDDEIAVAILGTMPGRSAGMILAFVNPEKAARLTKAISERRLDPTLLLNQAENIPAP